MPWCYICVIVAPWGFLFEIRCVAGGISSVSSGMMWCARCGSRLSACQVWNYMSPCEYTFRGGAEIGSGVASGVSKLGGGMGGFCCCVMSFVGVHICIEAAMLITSKSCFKVDFFLLTNAVSGIVGFGLKRVWVRSVAARVARYFRTFLEMRRLLGKPLWCQILGPYMSWGCRILGSGNAALLV